MVCHLPYSVDHAWQRQLEPRFREALIALTLAPARASTAAAAQYASTVRP